MVNPWFTPHGHGPRRVRFVNRFKLKYSTDFDCTFWHVWRKVSCKKSQSTAFLKIINKNETRLKKKNRASLNNCSSDVDSVSRYATSAVLVSLIRRAVASMGHDEAIASSWFGPKIDFSEEKCHGKFLKEHFWASIFQNFLGAHALRLPLRLAPSALETCVFVLLFLFYVLYLKLISDQFLRVKMS